MRIVKWTTPAQQSAERFLDLLLGLNSLAAKRASEEIQAATRRLVYMPTPGRASQRWPGARELSLVRWKKLIVFKILPDRISVIAFLDARQDLDVIDLSEV
ncbi:MULTISPECIES: type II toxin-antitoxin system RelE/ParE family toxin [unclassified Caulobacter]|uniref:type II toxin-antitoxin system RelE/ParE family toxin n=1 Tax=unclassified Caulobacter TaxID=2648921 RepID=UPI001304893C|nr:MULTISPECIES: type II toxin-antitoxin system RelE/ParE family toxin [unclassified Caulobacter]